MVISGNSLMINFMGKATLIPEVAQIDLHKQWASITISPPFWKLPSTPHRTCTNQYSAAISTVTMQGSSNYLRHCTRHSDLKKITSHSNLAAILFPCHAIQNVRFLSGFLVVLLHHKQILQKNNEYLFFGTFFALITGINIMAIVNAYPQRYF